MSRLTPAAAHLIDQVTQLNPNVKAEAVGPQDGYGVLRSVRFDARTSKWLAPALDAIQDERIRTIDYEGKGRATVTFVGDTRADHRDNYPLDTVLRILEGKEDE